MSHVELFDGEAGHQQKSLCVFVHSVNLLWINKD